MAPEAVPRVIVRLGVVEVRELANSVALEVLNPHRLFFFFLT
jgi:hypothetical protein